MKNGELIEYLNMFPKGVPVTVLLASIRGRKVYDCEDVLGITYMGYPVIGVIIGAARDMDEDEVAACEEEERAV